MLGLVAKSNSTDEEVPAMYAMPATPLQVRLWNLCEIFGPDPAWNVAVRFRLSGQLDRERLEWALHLLTDRHEALRTSFAQSHKSVQQNIVSHVTLPVEWCDLRSLSGGAKTARVQQLSLAHARHCMRLDSAPLLRVRVLRLQDDEHLLLWNAHHSICDGWSVGLLASDLMECYGRLSAGQQPVLRNALDYADYAVWLDAQRRTPEYEEHRNYWAKHLRRSQAQSLPASWCNQESGSGSPEILSTLLPRELTDALASMAQQYSATFFHAVLAAFAALMRTHQEYAEVRLGTPLSGRDQEELENVVGAFVNYLPLHFQVDIHSPYSTLLQSVRDQVTDSLEHAQFRYEDMLAGQQNAGTLSPEKEQLFSSVFICQQDFVRPCTAGGLSLTAVPSVSPGALQPLTVFIVERAEGWRLSCEVDNRIVSASAGLDLLEQYQRMLAAVAAYPEGALALLATRAGLILIDKTTVDTSATLSQVAASQLPTGENEGGVQKIPASEAQVRFWMLDRLNPGDASFDLRIRLELTGPLQADALVAAIENLTGQQEILRTTFEEVDGQVWQIIHPESALDFRRTSITASPDQSISEDGEQGAFSLTAGPLFRVRLVQVEKDRHWLAITLSHAIADGWSSGVFLEQLRQAYEQCLNGSAGPAENSPVQFSTYVDIERSRLASAEKEQHLEWWREHLEGSWLPLTLPRDVDEKAPRADYARAAISSTVLAPGTVFSVRRFARESNATVFAVFGAAFQALLARYSGQSDVLFLTPFANRPEGTENILGPLANPVCLTGHVAGETTFRTLVTQLSHQSMDAMEHALPLSLVAPLLDMRVVRGHHPLNQITFFYQRAFVHDMQWGTLQVKTLPEIPEVAGGEWQLGIVERRDGISVEFLYDATLYSEQTMRYVEQHYARLLARAALDPDTPLSQLQILISEELMLHAAGQPLLPVTQSLLPRKQEVRTMEVAAQASNRAPQSPGERAMLRIWQEIFGIADLGVESNFFDLGGHSLLLARLQATLEREFNVRLTTADVFRQPTIAALGAWLEKAQNTSGLSTITAQMPDPATHDPHIIPIQPLGAGRPVFVISQSMIFRTLADELGTAQPMYALQMLDEDITPAMESACFGQLADFYVRLIREVQPTGPYRLGGWCVSGWIAYAVAQQLEEQGEKIELLMIMDAWAPAYWRKQPRMRHVLMQTIYRGQRLRWVGRRLRQSAMPERTAYIRKSLHGIAAAAAQNLSALLHRLHLPVRVRLTEEMRRSEQLEYTASRTYIAGPLKGNVLLFRSEEQPMGPLLAPDMGWSQMIGRPTQVEQLPGDHQEIFDLPGARIMAQRACAVLCMVPPAATMPDASRKIGDPESVMQGMSLMEASCARLR